MLPLSFVAWEVRLSRLLVSGQTAWGASIRSVRQPGAAAKCRFATIAERTRPWGAPGTTRPSPGHSSRPAAVGRPSAHYRLQRLRVPVSDFVPAEILENVLAGLGAHLLPALRVVQQFDDDPGKAFRVVPVE